VWPGCNGLWILTRCHSRPAALRGCAGRPVRHASVCLAGFGVFAAASLACGVAPDAAWLVAAGVAQGLGAALVVPNSLAMLNHATGHDPRLRARAIGLWTAAGGISIGAGPVIGGLLIASLGWRSIFPVNLSVCAAGAAQTLAFAPESAHGDSNRRMDLPGQTLAILAFFGLIGGMIEARPLVSATRWCWVLQFLAAGGAFIAVERRMKQPILPPRFFSDPGFNAAIGFGIAVNRAYYGVTFVQALYLRGTRGWSALQAGPHFLTHPERLDHHTARHPNTLDGGQLHRGCRIRSIAAIGPAQPVYANAPCFPDYSLRHGIGRTRHDLIHPRDR
jgi:MFS family permease